MAVSDFSCEMVSFLDLSLDTGCLELRLLNCSRLTSFSMSFNLAPRYCESFLAEATGGRCETSKDVSAASFSGELFNWELMLALALALPDLRLDDFPVLGGLTSNFGLSEEEFLKQIFQLIVNK